MIQKTWGHYDKCRDWGQEEKGMTEDEMAGWHHQLDAHEFGWTLGVGDGQGDLACCDSWGHKESDTTEWMNWTELIKTQDKFCMTPSIWSIQNIQTYRSREKNGCFQGVRGEGNVELLFSEYGVSLMQHENVLVICNRTMFIYLILHCILKF